jgi:DNA-directed RNA polymerase specialized sigma24 family protein
MVAPEPLRANEVSSQAVSNNPEESGSRQVWPVAQAEISALFELNSFERFAFVMSVLEGYSDQDCALLLGCTRQALIAARVRALQQIASGAKQKNTGSNTKPLHDSRPIVELTFPARLATPA